MTLKVKLFDKESQQEVDDFQVFFRLSSKIEEVVREEFSDYDFKVKIYGEIVPIKEVT